MTHSEEKARDFFRFHLIKRSPSKYVYYGLSIITFLGAVVFLFLGRFYYALFFTFLSLMLLLIRRVTINITINKIIKNLRLPNYSYSLSFFDDKVVYETEYNRKEYKYYELLGIHETKVYIFLYISPNAALIVNKLEIDSEKRTELGNYLSRQSKYRHYRFK